MSSTIREIDKNMERIDCEFARCNERINSMMDSLPWDYQKYDNFSLWKIFGIIVMTNNMQGGNAWVTC